MHKSINLPNIAQYYGDISTEQTNSLSDTELNYDATELTAESSEKFENESSTGPTNGNLEIDELSLAQTNKDAGNDKEIFEYIERFCGSRVLGSLSYYTDKEKRIQEIQYIRSLMKLRPEYFKLVLQKYNDLDAADMQTLVFSKFLQESVSSGTLSQLVNSAKLWCAESNDLKIDYKVLCKFLDNLEWLISYIAEGKDPTLHGFDEQKIERFVALEIQEKQMLDETAINEITILNRQEKANIIKEIREYKYNMISKAYEYLISLLLALNIPNYQLDDENTKKETQEKLDKNLLEYLTKIDLINSENFLRNFNEDIFRRELGKSFYKIICDYVNNAKNNKFASLPHTNAIKIFKLSITDIISKNPKEAKSRSLSHNQDGKPVINFGYKDLVNNQAYKAWLEENPLVPISADIIVDSFNSLRKFLVEKTNVETLRNMLQDYFRDPNFILNTNVETKFIWQLVDLSYETVTGEKFESYGKLSMKSVLIGLKGINELVTEYNNILDNMVKIATKSGVTLGIGFKGRIFGTTVNAKDNDHNNIYLAFSKAARKLPSSKIFLEFVKKSAFGRLAFDKSKIELSEEIFEKYKILIKLHVNKKVTDYSDGPYYPRDEKSIIHYLTELNKYKSFLAQLDRDLSFNDINCDLKEWINESSNWYNLPLLSSGKAIIYEKNKYRPFELVIIDNFSVEENKFQEFVRNFIFDALISKDFCELHDDFIDLLFVHWKDELKAFDENIELTKISNPGISASLNKFVKENINQEFADFWESNIAREFDKYIVQSQISTLLNVFKYLKGCLPNLDPNINTILDLLSSERKKDEIDLKQLLSNISKIYDISQLELGGLIELLEKYKGNLVGDKKIPQLEKKIEELCKKFNLELGNLDEIIYKDFKAYFFKKNDASQCIEPLFSKFVGHEKFLPLKVTNINKTVLINDAEIFFGNDSKLKIINPCDERCQYHVLGHVQVSDMLVFNNIEDLDKARAIHQLGEVENTISEADLNIYSTMCITQ